MIHAATRAGVTLQVTAADLRERAEACAAIALVHADDVDANARFPIEAIEALKAAGLLGAMVPVEFGGFGASLGALADVCMILGRSCASTAMIFAMHQIDVACVIQHHGGSPWLTDFLRAVARDQLLLASSTTEGSTGGAVRQSSAPVQYDGVQITLDRAATVVSYGGEADGIITTARRNADAGPSDQVLVVFLRSDYDLTSMGEWNTLGMRGTSSRAFALKGRGSIEQIVPTPYAQIHAQTMTPAAHILWSSVWTGVASEAVDRARLYVRKSGENKVVPGAGHLAEAKGYVQTLAFMVSGSIARHALIKDDPAALEGLPFQTAMSLLKVEASEMAVKAVMTALTVCGLTGYRNDGSASVSRMLRDILSAPLMVSNDRILIDMKPAALMDRGPRSLSGGY